MSSILVNINSQLKICSPLQSDSIDGRGLRISSSVLSLFDVQKEILRYQSSHFNPGNSMPLNYVKTLFIIGAYDEVNLFSKGSFLFIKGFTLFESL